MLSPVVMDCRKHRQISYDMPVELISKSPDKLLLLFIIYRYGSCPSYHEMLWFPSGLSFTTWTGSICRTINGFVKLLLVRFRSFFTLDPCGRLFISDLYYDLFSRQLFSV